MKYPFVSDLVGIINNIAPPRLAESWDNCGLQVGDPARKVGRILVALDPLASVVAEAVGMSADLLVTHHPLIFSPLTAISRSSVTGSLIHDAIAGGLSICALHTSYDSAVGGLNDELADRLGLSGTSPLAPSAADTLAKLVVFVPESHLDAVRDMVTPYAENIGNYSECSFAAPGYGTFRPEAGSSPFVGTEGTRETVPEQRLEMLVSRSRITRVLDLLRKVHPYEEPAFDIYPVIQVPSGAGLGRIGRLADPLSLSFFSGQVKKILGVSSLRVTGIPDAMLKRVAVCGGSGASMLREAVRAGADAFVTGDVKYHDARMAQDLGIALLDAGHFHTEKIMVPAIAEKLKASLTAAGFDAVEVSESACESDPFRYI